MQEQLEETFKLDPGKITHNSQGVIEATAQHKMELLHARETTGDRAQNMVTGKRGTAGEIWKDATGKSVREFQCAIRNCPNKDYRHGQRHQAEVAAHVYSATQGSNDPVNNTMLTPTCNACNNRKGTENTQTCYPKVGEVGHPLEAYPDTKFVPIEISDKTEQKMIKAGKGTGKGGRIERGGALGGGQVRGGALGGGQVRGGALGKRQVRGGALGGRQVRGGALGGGQVRGGALGGRQVRGGALGGTQMRGGGGLLTKPVARAPIKARALRPMRR